jgi:hypothetical protein
LPSHPNCKALRIIRVIVHPVDADHAARQPVGLADRAARLRVLLCAHHPLLLHSLQPARCQDRSDCCHGHSRCQSRGRLRSHALWRCFGVRGCIGASLGCLLHLCGCAPLPLPCTVQMVADATSQNIRSFLPWERTVCGTLRPRVTSSRGITRRSRAGPER